MWDNKIIIGFVFNKPKSATAGQHKLGRAKARERARVRVRVRESHLEWDASKLGSGE